MSALGVFATALADPLPGLWALALCAMGTGLLHRFYDRVPRRALAVGGALVVIFLGPPLFGAGLLVPLDGLRGSVPFTELAPTDPHGNPLQGDLLQLVAPATAEVGRAFESGRWPLWAPRFGAGMPLLADPQAQALQPLSLAALPFGPTRGAVVVAALRVFFAFLFTLVFLRRQGLGTGAATLGATAWAGGGFLQLWLGWPLANVTVYLPALLYGLQRVVDRGGRRDILLLTTVGAGLLLAGHPETILYSLLLGLAFLLSRDRRRVATAAADGLAAGRRGRLASVALAGLLAAGLAAPALLPTAAYIPQTLRFARLADAPPPRLDEDPGRRAAGRLLPTLTPNAFGNSRYGAYWGPTNTNEDAAGFVGSTATLLALLAALGLLTRRQRRPGGQEGLFLVAATASALVLALPPGLPSLLAALPGGTMSDHHHRVLLILGFSLAVLAAHEVDRRSGQARGGASGRRRLDLGAVAAVALPALGLAALATWSTLAHPHPEQPETLDVLRDGWLRWHLRFYGATLLALVVFHGRRWLPWGLTILVAAELALAHRPMNPASPPRLAFPTTGPLAFLQDQAGAEDLTGPRIAGLDANLPPNLAAVYGLADARVYSPMAPAAYATLTAPLFEEWSSEVPRWGRPEHPVYDLLGVEYLVASPDAPRPESLVEVHRDSTGAIWRRPNALPLLFLPAAARVGGEGSSRDAAALLAGSASPRQSLRVTGGAAARPWRATHPDSGEVRLEHRTPERLRATYRAGEHRLLATSLYDDGGWRLLIDGSRRPVQRINGTFLGGWLPPGSGEVLFLYRPWAFLLGSGAAGLALATCLGLGATAGRRRPERTEAPGTPSSDMPIDRGAIEIESTR